MEQGIVFRSLLFGAGAWLLPLLAAAQTPVAQTAAPALSGPEIVERVSPSVVLILARDSGGANALATGLVVQSDGVVLTAYHAVKNAHEAQVRLKNGEIFDQVELIAHDERRDVAALRITATGLPAILTTGLADVRSGQEVYAVSHASGLTWTASSGIVSAIRLADEVPGAGRGYRIVQFTAPVSAGSSGGVLVDTQGRALGIIVGGLTGGHDLNFAVPLESVVGLARHSGGKAFALGTELQPPGAAAPPSREPAPPPRRQAESPFAPATTEQPVVQPINPRGPELSTTIKGRDPNQILRAFRTVYVASRTVYMKPDVMQAALQREPAFQAWGLAIVADPRVADVRLTVDRVLFTWTFTYELVHQNTGIVLDTGKLGAIDGMAAAPKIAHALVQRISAVRGKPEATAPPQKQ